MDRVEDDEHIRAEASDVDNRSEVFVDVVRGRPYVHGGVNDRVLSRNGQGAGNIESAQRHQKLERREPPNQGSGWRYR